MDPAALIPVPNTIPAPAWVFQILDVPLFLIHIVLVNLVVGGSLIALFSALRRANRSGTRLPDVISHRLPLLLPFAITIGVAPLLFVQVVYGHFFYTSSVLMARYWIAVIPLLILAYYGVYLYAHRMGSSPIVAWSALTVSAIAFLYIGFVYVNNFTLMVQPHRWIAYFQNRSGTLLNLSDPTLIPRYLHFLAASIAVAALFMAILWDRRSGREPADYSKRVGGGLKLFGAATIFQVLVGFWFLSTLPSSVIGGLLGQDIPKTAPFLLAFLFALGAVATAFMGKLRPTVVQSVATLLFMAITRHNVRSLYLEPYFNTSQLRLVPQYGVLVLFVFVLAAGLAAILYMVRISAQSTGSHTDKIREGGVEVHAGEAR
jgi:succinate dehydrogenase hydrophobic anchor subunit